MSNVKFGRLSPAATAVLCLALAGCAATASHQPAAENEIVIGVAGPMSGSISKFGQEERRGVALAVDDINAAGGLLGKQIRLEAGDDQCDPKKAVIIANDMVSLKASLVVGHFCSGSSNAAAATYISNNIVQITPASTDPHLTNRGPSQSWKTLFRVINPNDRQSSFVADWIIRKYPQGRIAVLDDGDMYYGGAIANELAGQLQHASHKPIVRRSFQPRSGHYDDLIGLLKSNNIDLVYIGAFEDGFAHIVREARAEGVTAIFIGPDALNNSEFASMAGAAADGVRFVDSVVPFGTPEADKIGARLQSNDRDPESYALPSYAAVQAWAEGVKRAGTTDGVKVAAAMRSAPIDTVIGKLSWDKKGDIEQMRYAWFVWHGGSYAQEHSN
ncbi:MAG TPA: branched-chain amino acid ABC transporter substrate-binding protein [Dongiaceae bacterium]|nr:branched-chain amino acid ABC transporter substrate-binding protein [Dongiaceae bacterium]